MALAHDDIEQIQNIVQQAINNTPELRNSNVRYELDLRERTIRVEEELKHQRELMIQGFAQMDKRFEQVDKRFEQVDKHFEQIQLDMNKRFEKVDKHFEQMQSESNQRFSEIVRRLDRFMFWSLGITVSCAVFVVSYLK